MIRNHFKIAWRSILTNKGYSLLNILGLAGGMAVALLIGLWVHYQFSYDTSLEGHDKVFKVGKQYTDKSIRQTVLSTPQPLAEVLRKDALGIQYVARTDWMQSHGLQVDDKKVSLPGGMVGEDFLHIFKHPFLKGNADNALEDPYSVVLSQSTARALFGNDDPLNKTVRIDNSHDLKVTGVIEDVPANSTLQFSFLVPMAYYIQNTEVLKENASNWSNYTFQTFVSLKPGVSYARIQPAIKNIFAKYDPQDDKKANSELILQPMNNWHLYGSYENGVATGFIDYVKMFSIIGVLVLLIACINFVNLATARSEKRAREVGIRKTIGSLRSQLIMQFLTESVLMVFLAFCICLLIVLLALPAFNTLTDVPISIPYSSGIFWLCMVAFIIITGLIAGTRPAFYLSSFKPTKVLKGVSKAGTLAALPKKALVVLQFTCSIALIIGTVIIYQQVQHAKNRPTGYSTSQLVMTEATPDIKRNFDALKNDLLQSGVVTEVTQSSSPVTENTNFNGILQWPGHTSDENIGVATVGVADPDYFATMDMNLLDGRNFKGTVDSLNVVVNESAVAAMQLDNPVNKMIRFGVIDQPVRIIGVVKDALMSSPFSKPQSTIFFYNSNRGRVITYRLKPAVNAQQALVTLTDIFNKYNPSVPYIYNFVDEAYSSKFKLEVLIGKLAGIFATLAIFISCLGLFGLVAYTAEQRKKEIGVRKTLGASISQIWLLLSKDFAVLLFISSFIAAPVAFYFLHNWLQQYEYRITISAWVFIATMLLSIIVALVTVSFQAIKAAIANPVKSLRTE